MQLGLRTRTYDSIFVDGCFVAAQSDRRADVVSPRTEEVIGRVPLAGPADVDRAVAAARAAFDDGEWPRWSPAERAAALRRLADHLDRRTDELAELGVEENGYPIAFSEGYMAVMPSINLRTYADLCETYPFEEERLVGGMLAGPARAGRVAVAIPRSTGR
jgi:betaine-aldehyde dehydrogenase